MVATAAIQTFAINGLTAIIFIFVGLQLIRRSGVRRITVTFALFFITTALGLLINVAYRVINELYWNILLNKMTIFVSGFAVIFLLEFNMLIRFSESEISVNRQILYAIVYALFLIVLFFIPDGVEWYYDPLKPDDIGVPVWSPLFAWYGGILVQLIFFYILYNSYKIASQFSDPKMKKKYSTTYIAIIMFDFIMVGNFVANGLNIPEVRQIFMIGSAISMIFGTYWLYQGVKRTL